MTRRVFGRVLDWRWAGLAAALSAMLFLIACVSTVGPAGPVWSIGEGAPPGYITGNIPGDYQGRTNPYDWRDPDARQAGLTIYFTGTLSCGLCHGGTGRGDGTEAPYLDYRPPAFASPWMLNAFREHQDYVFWWVSEGVARSSMPAFRDVLDETQRWQVITYAWSLGEMPAPPAGQTTRRRGPPMPLAAPASER